MTASNGTLIRLEGVKKVFFTDEVETHALAGIHLEMRKGEYVSIAGPSGCGKSTLLSILGLLDSPTEGSYTLNGKPVANRSLGERTRIRNRYIVSALVGMKRTDHVTANLGLARIRPAAPAEIQALFARG